MTKEKPKSNTIDMDSIKERAEKRIVKLDEKLFSSRIVRKKTVLPNGVTRLDSITIPCEEINSKLGVSDIMGYVAKLPDVQATAFIKSSLNAKVQKLARDSFLE